jgi:hypothetical protein
MEWINLNRNALPEAPFHLIVTSYMTGISSGGDRFDTNREQLFLEMIPDNVIAPTDGTTTGGNISPSSEELSGETAVAE